MTTKNQQITKFKGVILFLHGYTQNSSIFYAKTSALRKKILKLGYKCKYLNGPYVLQPSDLPTTDSLSKFGSSDNQDVTYRGWWIKNDHTNDSIDLDKSIDSIRNYIENGILIPDDESQNKEISKESEEDKELPIVGLIGFSQGASFAGLIAENFQNLFNTKNPLKFVILYSGFKLDTSKSSKNDKYNSYYDEELNPDLKYLHVYGELDTVVDEVRSLSLYNITKPKSDLLKHPGGHFVPNSKLYIDQVVNWIQSVTKDDNEKVTNQPGKGDVNEKKSKLDTKDDIESLLDMMEGFGKA
ncbi:FSH3 [Candida pseudojiufengensis]|uniref:FSH3 n=1 Tax=Candida pseudojiufengensis TaxID=497109 RepID=UPI0022243CA9|nr:FSH3 [Candida pseudojiufengensis]KAI5958519.1 FSH3 [Candida pseudojiufengensis]